MGNSKVDVIVNKPKKSGNRKIFRGSHILHIFKFVTPRGTPLSINTSKVKLSIISSVFNYNIYSYHPFSPFISHPNQDLEFRGLKS